MFDSGAQIIEKKDQSGGSFVLAQEKIDIIDYVNDVSFV